MHLLSACGDMSCRYAPTSLTKDTATSTLSADGSSSSSMITSSASSSCATCGAAPQALSNLGRAPLCQVVDYATFFSMVAGNSPLVVVARSPGETHGAHSHDLVMWLANHSEMTENVNNSAPIAVESTRQPACSGGGRKPRQAHECKPMPLAGTQAPALLMRAVRVTIARHGTVCSSRS